MPALWETSLLVNSRVEAWVLTHGGFRVVIHEKEIPQLVKTAIPARRQGGRRLVPFTVESSWVNSGVSLRECIAV